MATRRRRPGVSLGREHLSDSRYWDWRAAMQGMGAVMWPNEAFNRCVDRLQRRTLVDLLGDVSGRRVLDVGCGQGRLSLFLADQGAHVTGIDFSEAMIACAVADAVRRDVRGSVRFLRMALDDLPSLGESFDDAISVGCLAVTCADRSLLAAAEALGTALVPGGRVLLMEPIHRRWPLRRVCGLSRAAWTEAFERSGFAARCRSLMICLPVKFLCGLLPVPDGPTTTLVRAGEALLRLPGAGPLLADYTVLLLERLPSTGP